MFSHHVSLVSALKRCRRVGLLSLTLLTLGVSGAAQAEPFAYITNQYSYTVSVLDTATNAVTATVPVGDNPIGVAVSPDGAFVYVANRFSATVSVIDTASNTVVATVGVGDGPVAFGQFIGPVVCAATAR